MQLSAQTLSGKVVSADDQEAVPFATVYLEGATQGVITDINGEFNMDWPLSYKGNFYIRHINFRTDTIENPVRGVFYTVELSPKQTQLDELVIKAGDNPAYPIVRELIKNRKKHDPKRLRDYSFLSYTKEVYRLEGNNLAVDSIIAVISAKPVFERTATDSAFLKGNDRVKNNHIFVSESVSEIKKINPGVTNETILASNISGSNSPLFAATSTLYQPFGFYDDAIEIVDTEYVSPINGTGLFQYDFYIEDTTFYQKDTVFVLSFEPRRNVKGLRGLLSVHKKDHALVNVTASSSDKTSKIQAEIIQQYEKINGLWFPSQLNTTLQFNDIVRYGRRLILDNRRYLSSVKINQGLKQKDMTDYALSLSRRSDNDSLMRKLRYQQLDSIELRTFAKMDSMSNQLAAIESLATAILTMRAPAGILNLRLDKIVAINRYENVRLGLGLETNDSFSRRVRFGGSAGYGFGDKEWKYAGDALLHLNRRNESYLLASYKKDIREAGKVIFFEETRGTILDAIRTWQGNLFEAQRQYKFTFNTRIAPFFYGQLSYSSSMDQTTYPYQYAIDGFLGNKYDINEASLSLRYAKNEKYLNLFGSKVPLGSGHPVIKIKYSMGRNREFSGDFDFQRIDAELEYEKKHLLGKSEFFVRAGYINGQAPFGRLMTGWGNNSSIISVTNYFQTMGLYEFLSDRSAGLFLSHNFGNVFWNQRWSRPELIGYQNTGIGSLDHPERHNQIFFNTMEKGYLETGLGLDNLIRFNYLNIGYFGLGVDTFYRYGPYQLDETKDNMVFKLNMSLSL